ncbi:MAG: PD-(D/E)XK nuclease family protein [Candidatus Diapherotrites archaeon]|nr:PD-(D/E)XK nuclease family protein [Candidatus Diapherotrites archaeon]
MIPVSAVADTAFCERLAYIKHILKMPPRDTRLYYWGTIKHNVIESIKNKTVELDKAVDKTLPLRDIEKYYSKEWMHIVSKYLEEMRESIESNGLDFNFVYDDLKDEIKKRAKAHAGKIVKGIYKPVSVLTEKFISSQTLGMRGRIDSIEIIDGKVIPHEYKSAIDVPKERVWRDTIQLASYGLLIQKEWKRDSPYGILEYAHEEKRIEFTNALFQNALQYKRRFELMERGVHVPSRSNMCDFCLYKDICNKSH